MMKNTLISPTQRFSEVHLYVPLQGNAEYDTTTYTVKSLNYSEY